MKLNVSHLSFAYGSRAVLEDVCFEAREGELLCVLGPNGAGKSTLFKCVLGLLPDYEGQILLDGADAAALPPRARANRVAYIPQSHAPAFNYSVFDVALMGTTHQLSPIASPGPRQRESAMRALAQLGIAGFAQRGFANLSGGEQQLALIARALAQQARMLVMDEPTANLDYGNQLRVLARVRALSREGYAVLLSTHNPQHALTYADRILALHSGRVVADGPPGETLTQELLGLLYGVDARLVAIGGQKLILPRSGVEE
ncbi:MAG TPA: ABC transporter ATP-binding protein [Clostridia bacterium]|nr:MAG: Hemin import ATP-binding protein HmuV [Firmicutes bacterium ADurb.Bin248]HOG01078.1 ABC transporter ATP-binding protein [Clostridia bacterium]HOS17929.1 ABC transporter ATP-binding protein [Clostridia bacterium]HPK14952.1 ABC transporter ATP-binding protein [Clostridia bacterium]